MLKRTFIANIPTGVNQKEGDFEAELQGLNFMSTFGVLLKVLKI
jgi:hypothetical protein